MPGPIAKYDWPSIRTAYVNESPKPSYSELSERFLIPIGTLTRVLSDEGWPDLRSARLASVEQTQDTLAVLTKASSESRIASSMAFEAIQGAIAGVIQCLADIANDKELKPRARSDMLNTLCFALQNASNASKGFGIVGLPDALKRLASDVPGGLNGRGEWTPGMLQQINLTVQNMTSEAKTAEKTVGAAETALDMDSTTTK